MAGKRRDRPYLRDDDTDADVQAFQARHRSFSDRLERFLMQLVILGLVGLVLVQLLQVFPPMRRQMNLVDALEGVSANERNAWSQLGTTATASTATVSTATSAAATTAATSAAATAPATSAQPLTVTVLLASQRSAPEARLLVDGKSAGNFAGGSVTASVKPGQIISVDGTGSRQTLTFRVVGAPGVATPAVGTSVTTYRNQQRLGDVRAAR